MLRISAQYAWFRGTWARDYASRRLRLRSLRMLSLQSHLRAHFVGFAYIHLDSYDLRMFHSSILLSRVYSVGLLLRSSLSLVALQSLGLVLATLILHPPSLQAPAPSTSSGTSLSQRFEIASLNNPEIVAVQGSRVSDTPHG